MARTDTPQQLWHGSIVHTELGSTDPAATTDFLGRVFGMRFETTPGPIEYHNAYEPGRPSCGVRAVMEQEPGPSQTPYVGVVDLDATVAAAEENGATVIVPKQAVPGRGWFAWLQVPGGPMVAAWQEDPGAR